jgi:A/G-specific adenine glycosylase
MLQQTQVRRVLPKYTAFIDRYPRPSACASASVGEILGSWAGLGYNRRAVNLHRCARAIVDHHGGRVPDDLDSLLVLPGIGPYTARAVLAFAFERDVGIVDTNAARVLARWRGGRLLPREVQQAADESVPRGRSWLWNQGMLDLGATVCTKRSPSCGACPVQSWCAWFVEGLPQPDPTVGSAGVTGRQSRFDGSDRQGRGRLVDALRADGQVTRARIAATAGWSGDEERALRVAHTLVADGLAEWSVGGSLTFPSSEAQVPRNSRITSAT